MASRALILFLAALYCLPWDYRAASRSAALYAAAASPARLRDGLRGRRLADAAAPPDGSADGAAGAEGTSSAANSTAYADRIATEASVAVSVAAFAPGDIVPSTNRVNAKCALAQQQFGAIYTFGDSLADVGNNNYGGTGFYHANFPPYGMNFIPASGRFTDGKLVFDYLSEHFQLAVAPPAFNPNLSISSAARAAPAGLNFASSGAGVLDSTNAGQVFPLSAQLSRFTALGGLQTANQTSHPPLAVVSIATNDYLRFLSRGINVGRWMNPREQLRLAQVLPRSQRLIASVVAGIADAVRTLYASGFRHFLLFDTLPIGCTPLGLATLAESFGQLYNDSAPSRCSLVVNLLTGEHSSNLGLALDVLREQLIDATIVYARMHDLITDMAERPGDYGLTVGTEACCGAPAPINGLVQCGTSIFISNGTEASTPATLCDDSQSRVFWDFVHPTQATNQVVAQALVCALQAGRCDVDLIRFANREQCTSP